MKHEEGHSWVGSGVVEEHKEEQFLASAVKPGLSPGRGSMECFQGVAQAVSRAVLAGNESKAGWNPKREEKREGLLLCKYVNLNVWKILV